MPLERVVLVVTHDQGIIIGLPKTIPGVQDVLIATHLDQAIWHLHDFWRGIGQVYFDPRTPRVQGGRPGPFPDNTDYFQNFLLGCPYRGPMFTIVDNAADGAVNVVERDAVGKNIATFFNAPE